MRVFVSLRQTQVALDLDRATPVNPVAVNHSGALDTAHPRPLRHWRRPHCTRLRSDTHRPNAVEFWKVRSRQTRARASPNESSVLMLTLFAHSLGSPPCSHASSTRW